MTPIAEFYFHLKPFGSEPETIDAFGRATTELGVLFAQEYYGIPVDVEVRVDRGSLRGWVTWAVVGSLYYGIASYPDFCNGTQLLVSQARGAGEFVSEHLFNAMRVDPDVIYRTERRTATPGAVLRALGELDRASTKRDQLAAILRLQNAMKPLELGDKRTIEKLVQEAHPGVSFGTGFHNIVEASRGHSFLREAPAHLGDRNGMKSVVPLFHTLPTTSLHRASENSNLAEWLERLRGK